MKPFPQMLGLRTGAIETDVGDDRANNRRNDGAVDKPCTVDRALIRHRSTCLQPSLQPSGETQMNSCPLPSRAVIRKPAAGERNLPDAATSTFCTLFDR